MHLITFGRLCAAFCLMVAVGYLAIVTLLPAPAGHDRIERRIETDASARLSQEARALVGTKPARSAEQGPD